jgi:methyl-accepting chemotaxis protein
MISKKRLQVFLTPKVFTAILFYYYIAVISMTSFGGLYLLFNYLSYPWWLSLIFSIVGGLLFISWPILYFVKKYIRPHEIIKIGIKRMGEGRLYSRINLNRCEIFFEIAESVNLANQQLSDKLQSIIKNADRLSAVEHELSSHLKAKNAVDEHGRNLVCQLKISASRLKNDLSEFTQENSFN